jgi:uncharacterized protein (UPF0332 family)
MLREGFLRGAVNRAYYAVFHSASSALLWQDIERKKHSAIEALFNQLLVKTKVIEVEYAYIYKAAREWREEQDYIDFAREIDMQTAA